MLPADQKVSALSPAKLALYTGLSLQTVERLETGEDWVQWMRAEHGAPPGLDSTIEWRVTKPEQQ